MDAEAWAVKHRVIDHVIANETQCEIEAKSDGVVSVKFMSTQPFGIKGDYYFRIIFTSSEVDEMHRKSLVSEAQGRQAEPKLDRRI